MLAFFLGLAGVALALVWLSRLKQRDLAASAASLGLVLAAKGAETTGESAEGIPYHETLVAEGTIDGMAAQLSARMIGSLVTPRARRNVTQFTVLSLRDTRPLRVTLRLQPAGLMRTVERLAHAPPAVIPTGDPEFDAAYRLYADDPPAALAALPARLRAEFVAFRAAGSAAAPGTAADAIRSNLLLGTFEITPDRALYYVYGSPTAKTAAHVKQAAPLLAKLAGIR